MNLLAPLGLALGITLPVVVVFYLLKVRRHDEEVSSTFLWQDLIRDLAAHEPLQKLKWSVLLVLQLIALGLLTAAFARPSFERLGERPFHAVLLLDASASMQATDLSPSRFAQAVDAARKTLAGLPDGSHVTVLLARAHPQVLVSGSTDRRQAGRALEQAQPSGGAGNMREALLLARSLGGDPSERRIYVFTDEAFTLPNDLPDDLGAVEVTQTGTANAGNLAVTAISSRPDPRDNRRRQLFTRIQNFSDQPAQTDLSVAVDGQVIDERTIQIATGGESDQVFEDLPMGARAASVSIAGAAANTFPLDDSAYAVLSDRKPAQVLLVSGGNPFLEKVLSLLPNVELYRISDRRYLAIEADRFDVVIFDDYLPPLLPRGNLLVVNPPPRGPIRTNGDVVRPRVAAWDREDPLLSFVDIRDLGVNRARRLDLPRWAKPLIATGDGVPLLAAGQDGDRRIAIIPFDLRQSNLPLSPAFPILMSNLVAYLSPQGVVQSPEVRTGEPETLSPLPQVEQVRVTRPDDRASDIPVKSGKGPLTFGETDQPGLYRVQQLVAQGGQTVEEDLFAANLADPDESDVRARPQALAGSEVPRSGPVPLQQEVWVGLVALILPLLLFEWFWFHRKV